MTRYIFKYFITKLDLGEAERRWHCATKLKKKPKHYNIFEKLLTWHVFRHQIFNRVKKLPYLCNWQVQQWFPTKTEDSTQNYKWFVFSAKQQNSSRQDNYLIHKDELYEVWNSKVDIYFERYIVSNFSRASMYIRLALNKYVTLYYSKDVRLPVQLQRAMAAEAEAAREARAKVIAAEGEQKASHALKEAAKVIQESPSALQVCIVISILYQNPAFVLSILITRSL